MTHWQCACPHFQDSRIAAHNAIWAALAAHLKQRSDFSIALEQPMSSSAILVDPLFRNWQPDGIATSADGKTAFLLEFTRCSDDRKQANPQALERKLIKYGPLLASAQALNPHLSLNLLTFAVGYLGTLDQTLFSSHLRALGISASHDDAIQQSVMTATMSAFAKMALERATAINLHIPLPPCPWAGRHRPLRRPPPLRRV
jgi:hypothetical protein